MGGNAIKDVQRLDKEQYNELIQDIIPKLKEVLGERTIKVIKAYNQKDSFGDIDILVESYNLDYNWVDNVISAFKLSSNDYSKNGKVFSFRVHEYNFQADLILVSSEKLEIAYNYFNYNDFSNLIGRMTKKLGFKLGHDGLFYIERDGDHILTDECFSLDYYDALRYLELDVERYKQGFETLEDVFEYVASSPYFNPDIYLLHNRNHISRTRDKKRKTYSAFLKWCEEHNDELTHYSYDRVDDYDGYGSSNNTRVQFTQKLLEEHPLLHYKVLQNRANHVLNQEFKKYFNGHVVKEYLLGTTGNEVTGKELGMAMSKYKPLNTLEKKLETVKNKKYEF